MSFDKREYLYDDGRYSSEEDEGRSKNRPTDDLLTHVPDISRVSSPEPKDLIRGVLFELQGVAKIKGVELLDRCTTLSFAEFVSKYRGGVYWKD